MEIPNKKTYAFINKAISKHGDMYDYSRVHYKNSKMHVEIICMTHGTFHQRPEKHLIGQGCPKCGGTAKKTTKEFIHDARKIHGERYNYELVDYKNKSTIVGIICIEHGLFEQLPGVHLRGGGCIQCGIISSSHNRRLDVNELIVRFNKAHGSEYDYSHIKYVNNRTPVKIICRIHGPFYQLPYEHIKQSGCKICHPRDYKYLLKYVTGPLRARKAEVFNCEQITELAKMHHGRKYDYSKIGNVTRTDKVVIICPIHGEFEQTLINHLYGHQCRKCGFNNSAQKRLLTFDGFIKRASEIHNDKYNYDNQNWTGAKGKIKIICSTHGAFYQQGSSHLSGRGCSMCSLKTRSEKRRQPPNILIDRFQQRHGNAYEYDLSDFESVNQYITITCPTHGPFDQTPNNHLAGKGCAQCGNNKTGKALRATPSLVIKKFKEVHGDTFDYSLIPNNYVNADTPVPIICRVHGEFWQAPYNHQAGKSCPACKESQGERKVRKWFEDRRINFIKEWNDHDCIDIRPLKFDFFVPDYNAIVEYDGIHHYEVDSRWWEPDPVKRQESFELLKLHDWLKDEWCKENGLNMIRIHYKEVIEERLFSIFNDGYPLHNN